MKRLDYWTAIAGVLFFAATAASDGGAESLPRVAAAAAADEAATAAAAPAASAYGSFIGRPIYSEPTTGLQMPPSCVVEPSWRTRIDSGDFEAWIVVCGDTARGWLVHRQVLEVLGGGLARLRYQVVDERVFPGESAGDSLSVQCTGRRKDDGGYLVVGAKWHVVGKEMRLISALAVLRADAATQKFVAAGLDAVDCLRFPDREETMRQLQQGPR
jgi:hypothetical protein